MGPGAVESLLSLFATSAYGAAEVSDITSLIGSSEKITVVALLLGGLYIMGREVIAERRDKHALRNQLVQVNLAREMWKSAYLASGLSQDEVTVKEMLMREERLLVKIETP